jgi:hypothetical protein
MRGPMRDRRQEVLSVGHLLLPPFDLLDLLGQSLLLLLLVVLVKR